MSVIADTGFFVALANRSDRFHDKALSALADLHEPPITTCPVATETTHLLANRLGSDAALAFIRSALEGAFELFAIEESHMPRVLELMEKYRDLPMDLADASLVILAESLGTGRILSTDQRDFRTYRWKTRRPFTNILAR